MNKIISKLKYILEIILSFFKAILISFFGFFFNLFKSEQPSDELKAKKLDNVDNNDKTENKSIDISGYNENPSTLIINNDYSFPITTLELEKIILDSFCEELEIKEEDLTHKEKEYIKTLNEKIIPVLQNDINNKIISNKISLTEKIKNLVIEEFETQYELETNNKVANDKIIITPFIIKKYVNEPIQSNDTSTFIKNKIIQSKLQNSNNSLNIPINNIETNKVTDTIGNDNKRFEKQDNINNIETLFPEKLNSKTSNNNDNIFKTNQNSSNRNGNYVHYNDVFMNACDDPILDSSPTTFTENKKSYENQANISEPLQQDFLETRESKDNDVPAKIDNIDTKEEKKLEQTETYDKYDEIELDKLIQQVSYQQNEELKKEELEDKNYEILEKQINDLLNMINNLKLKNLNFSQKNKLIIQENKLLQLKNSLSMQKQKDIALEENILDSSILLDDLNLLEEHLQHLHFEDKLDIQKYMLNSLEDLDNLTLDKAKKIEKELLKIKLKKAIHALEIPSLLALPFIRNKYFMFFTSGLFVNRHLKFFDAILKRKSIEFEPEELTHLKTGTHALEDALYISKQNIDYLDYLESKAFQKYPDLRLDADYLIHLNTLKSSLLKQQERLLKKEEMIQKHNLKLNKKIRKLKKKENQKI